MWVVLTSDCAFSWFSDWVLPLEPTQVFVRMSTRVLTCLHNAAEQMRHNCCSSTLMTSMQFDKRGKQTPPCRWLKLSSMYAASCLAASGDPLT